MPCSLTDDGLKCMAQTGAKVTIKVIASATKLLNPATYNDKDIPTADNSVTFNVVAGKALLLLSLAGPQDSVEVVEDCGDGTTHHLFGYKDDFHPVIGLSIVGS